MTFALVGPMHGSGVMMKAATVGLGLAATRSEMSEGGRPIDGIDR